MCERWEKFYGRILFYSFFWNACVQNERLFVAAIHDCRRLLKIAVRRLQMSQRWVNFCFILSREIISNFLRDEYIHHSSSSKHFPETCWTINILVFAITRRKCVRKIKIASPACNWSSSSRQFRFRNENFEILVAYSFFKIADQISRFRALFIFAAVAKQELVEPRKLARSG